MHIQFCSTMAYVTADLFRDSMVVERLDPAAFQPALQQFVHDKFRPRAILLEYVPDAEMLRKTSMTWRLKVFDRYIMLACFTRIYALKIFFLCPARRRDW
ncbi:uncharacterized protein BP01DRAFT_150690 [Aspergillus saccharolyticus JOP 1030-1]|uniref:Uncharacterized protein n=1 Tax=Aspergillus saccharolyticus JOP 1030-1 TaxID=1450539 RepID=A0A318ZVX5_9EURO|nr:hypothetical protein BP01DRAFT_150690 [Aspergillus saccharolyticus JOP 1030-1]PYH48513.1 hypothetical protein BP01DRAFT_150690 [Aspergillus saccharolyticus JOP 1030-1]